MSIGPILRKDLSQSAKEELREYLKQLAGSHTEKLPPETTLAQMLSVSRGTIRRALADLEKEGLLLRIHGRGTFLNPNGFQVKVNLGAMLEFGTVIRRSGYASRCEVLSVNHVPASGPVAAQLELGPGDELYRIVRVYYANEEPAIYSLALIPQRLFNDPLPASAWESASNFEVLQNRAGRLVMRDRVEIIATTVEQASDALQIEIPPTPAALLRLEACGYDQENLPVIWGSAYYRSDIVQFHLFRERE